MHSRARETCQWVKDTSSCSGDNYPPWKLQVSSNISSHPSATARQPSPPPGGPKEASLTKNGTLSGEQWPWPMMKQYGQGRPCWTRTALLQGFSIALYHCITEAGNTSLTSAARASQKSKRGSNCLNTQMVFLPSIRLCESEHHKPCVQRGCIQHRHVILSVSHSPRSNIWVWLKIKS